MPGNNYNNKRERFTNELDLEEFAQEWSSGCATPVSITNSWVQISSREMSSASEEEEEEDVEEETNTLPNQRHIYVGQEETLLKASLHSLLATTSTSRIRKKKSKKYYNHNTTLSASVTIPISQSSHINVSPPLLPLPSGLPHSPPTGGISNMLLNNESDAFRHPIERPASRTSVCVDENVPQAVLLDEHGFEKVILHNTLESGDNHHEKDSRTARVQVYKPGIAPTLALCWSRARSLNPPPILADRIPSAFPSNDNPGVSLAKRKREVSPGKAKAKSNEKTLYDENSNYKRKRGDDITMRFWMAALVSMALVGTGFSIGFGAGYYMRWTRFYATS
ncbi:hypothetical protein K7432_002024 [Basidiobolus ranarum]